MSRIELRELAAQQWQGYANTHQSALNLWLHLVAVPVFMCGSLLLILGLFTLNIGFVAFAPLLMAAAMGVQGFGHSKESVPATPFSSPLNAVLRIFLEQWYAFPRFVLSGGWKRAIRNK